VDAVTDRPAPGGGRGAGRVVALAGGLAVAFALAWALGLRDWARPERLAQLRPAIAAYGAWAPLLYVAGYVVAELLFVPALPLTLLGGLAFGPFWGLLYTWVAATLAAALAFLVARHLARDTVAAWLAASPRLRRIDAAVLHHGWRIVMVTRLVPFFPFNLQNFAYGLTRIPFWTYVAMSAVCMLPGTLAVTLAGGALSGGESPRRAAWSLAAAAGLIVLVSLAPRWLARRDPAAREMLAPDPEAPAP
jgi:uncharacterized membrane protein YdjX (TVP38/TMEM64 family)